MPFPGLDQPWAKKIFRKKMYFVTLLLLHLVSVPARSFLISESIHSTRCKPSSLSLRTWPLIIKIKKRLNCILWSVAQNWEKNCFVIFLGWNLVSGLQIMFRMKNLSLIRTCFFPNWKLSNKTYHLIVTTASPFYSIERFLWKWT